MPGAFQNLPYRPCVGILVLNALGQVWVGQRADAPGDAEGRGTWWQMPQGGIDPHEQPEDAALRELFEETGMRSVEILAQTKDWLTYDLPPHLLGRAWGGRYKGQSQKWFAMRFTGVDSEINITPDNPENVEFIKWRWTPSAELIASVVPFKRDVYTEVMREFAPLLGR